MVKWIRELFEVCKQKVFRQGAIRFRKWDLRNTCDEITGRVLGKMEILLANRKENQRSLFYSLAAKKKKMAVDCDERDI